MFPVRPVSATSSLYNSVQPRIQQALPKSVDLTVRSVSPAGPAPSRRFLNSVGSRGGLKTKSLVTLICAAGVLPVRAFAASMSETKTATFAAGCFWGVEHYFNKHFKGAILKSEVGYTGGQTKDPNYRQVCSGATGHAEAVRFEYDPSKAKYEDLVEYFYRIHDPTTKNRQGNDAGTQYRSAIYYEDDEQKRIAEEKTAELQKTKISAPITTEIVPEQQWYSAEEYHQKYLVNNPGGYCNHYERW